MFSDESNPFEIEENDTEFLKICSQLKSHAFPSPWNIFFKSSGANEFNSEVSEIIIEDISLINDNNTTAALSVKIVSNKSHSSDVSIDKKKIYQLKESLMSAQDDTTVDNVKDFDLLFSILSPQIPELFQILDILSINDAAINLFLNTFLHFKDQISITTAVALVHHVIGPLIFDFKKNSSRYLSTTILKFTEVYPKAMIGEVLVSYSKREKSDDSQSDIIAQITTNLPNEYVSYSIKRILEHALPVNNSFTVLKYLIERKVYHESTLYDLLLKKLLSWTSLCDKNVKFTKLLTSVLSVYGNELTVQQISLCNDVIRSNKTIIKRAAENLLRKLKADKFTVN